MPILKDILNLDGERASSNIPTRPDASFLSTAGTAISKPSITGKGLVNELLDFAQDSKEYSVEELQGMYPDAPEGTFKGPNTKRMGQWQYDRANNDEVFNAKASMRTLDSWEATKTVSGFGYELLKETSPTDLAIGMATGFGVGKLAQIAMMSKIAGVANAGRVLINGGAGATIRSLIAREAAESVLAMPIEYSLMKSLESSTHEEYTLGDAAVNVVGGTLLSSAGRIGYRQLKGSRILKSIDPDTSKAVNTGLQDYYDSANTSQILLPHQKQHLITNNPTRALPDSFTKSSTDIEIMKNMMPDDRVKYKVYSFGEVGQDISTRLKYSRNKGTPMFALFNKNSVASSNGMHPFGSSVQTLSNANDAYGFAAALRLGGDLVELNPNQFKLFNVEVEGPDTPALKKVLNQMGYGDENMSLAEAMSMLRKEGNEALEMELEAVLKELGYDGLTLKDTDTIAGKSYERVNSFIFDGIEGADKNILDTIDGSSALLDGHYIYDGPHTKTKTNILKDGELINTNGKTIKMSNDGYFETDVHFGSPNKILAYTEMFSKDQIDNINRLVELNRVKNIKKKYAGMTDDLIEHVKQIKEYQEFLDTIAKTEAKAKAKETEIPADLKQVFKDIFDDITTVENEKSIMNEMFKDLDRDIRIEDIAKKTIEQLDLEGKAGRLLDEADIVTRIKRMNDGINARLDSEGNVLPGKKNQIEALIRQYEEGIEYLKRNNPDVAEQIGKQADYCLRINS